MTTLTPAQFPLLRAARGNRVERFDAAVETFAQAVEAGSIFNVDFQDAKDCLGRAVDEAEAKVREDFTNGGKYQSLPSEVYEFLCSINLTNLHDVGATSKKLVACKLSHPAIEAYRALVVEAYPLHVAAASLKGLVVKGRKVDPKAVAARAAKLANVKSMARATCACCGSEQAVLSNGLIHDHGYTLPQSWHKSASCYGRQFPSLEVSSAGVVFMIDLLSKYIGEQKAALAALPARTEIKKENRFSKKLTVITPADAGWDYEVKMIGLGLKQAIVHASADLASFKATLASWKPAAK